LCSNRKRMAAQENSSWKTKQEAPHRRSRTLCAALRRPKRITQAPQRCGRKTAALKMRPPPTFGEIAARLAEYPPTWLVGNGCALAWNGSEMFELECIVRDASRLRGERIGSRPAMPALRAFCVRRGFSERTAPDEGACLWIVEEWAGLCAERLFLRMNECAVAPQSWAPLHDQHGRGPLTEAWRYAVASIGGKMDKRIWIVRARNANYAGSTSFKRFLSRILGVRKARTPHAALVYSKTAYPDGFKFEGVPPALVSIAKLPWSFRGHGYTTAFLVMSGH
jgi:hypothetical protein